jgi:RHS repeat-associated protein
VALGSAGAVRGHCADENPSGLGALEFSLRFAGQYADKESGNAQNWMRDYSSMLGRYMQSDPIGIAGGVNTYLYVSAQPTTRTDVAGLDSIGRSLEDALPEAYSLTCDAHALARIQGWTRQIEREQQSLDPCQRKCYIACFFIVQSELGECPRSDYFEIFPYNDGCKRPFITGVNPGHWKCTRGTIIGKSHNSCCRP